MPSTRICEWLPQIAHFNIFVLAHKNANELKLCMQLSVMVDVIGFSFKCYVLNTALSVRVRGARASRQLFFVHAFQLSVMVDVIPP